MYFKYDDDFITQAFRNLLIEFIKKKKKSLAQYFLVPFGTTSKNDFFYFFLSNICYHLELKWYLRSL